MLTIDYTQKALTIPADLQLKQTHSLLRRVNTNVCQVHSRVRGHMVEGSKVKRKPEHVAYTIMEKSRLIYKIIKLI